MSHFPLSVSHFPWAVSQILLFPGQFDSSFWDMLGWFLEPRARRILMTQGRGMSRFLLFRGVCDSRFWDIQCEKWDTDSRKWDMRW